MCVEPQWLIKAYGGNSRNTSNKRDDLRKYSRRSGGRGWRQVISRIQTELGVKLKKKLDRNHCVKNIVKHLYERRNSKDAKISNQVIHVQHLSKCIKYIFAKNKGNVDGMKENLQVLVPHMFGYHAKCFPRFCGYKRTPNQTYSHRS